MSLWTGPTSRGGPSPTHAGVDSTHRSANRWCNRRGGPMLPLLEKKIVFISGGSQGLGASIARAAVREGAQAVVVTGRRREPGEKLVAELAELTEQGAVTGQATTQPPRASRGAAAPRRT